MKGSWVRKVKRQAMKEAGLTWTARVSAAVATGKQTPDVRFKQEGRKIVAELLIHKR